MDYPIASYKRRQYPRIHLDQLAVLQQDLYQEDVFLFDLSLKGICFSLPKSFELSKEQPCSLTFDVEATAKHIEIKLDIVWISNDKVGTTWSDIDIQNLKNLAQLLAHVTEETVKLEDIKI